MVFVRKGPFLFYLYGLGSNLPLAEGMEVGLEFFLLLAQFVIHVKLPSAMSF
jgi:hypothetical protein